LAVRQEYPKRVWYIVALGVALFILANLWAALRRHVRRRTLIRQPLSSKRPNIYTGPISWRRLPLAIGSAWNIAAYRWTIPYGRSDVLSLSELGVTALYAAAVFTWSFINCQLHPIFGLESTLISFLSFLSSQWRTERVLEPAHRQYCFFANATPHTPCCKE
jgi:hypothetical protein